MPARAGLRGPVCREMSPVTRGSRWSRHSGLACILTDCGLRSLWSSTAFLTETKTATSAE